MGVLDTICLWLCGLSLLLGRDPSSRSQDSNCLLSLVFLALARKCYLVALETMGGDLQPGSVIVYHESKAKLYVIL
jgi:hypothetical protein